MIKIPGPKRILITMLVAGMVLTGCVKKTEGEAETSAASATDQKEEVNENIIDEGDDTPIEITKYSKYTGPNHENFLRPGDKIAVISPSALPTQEQTDATVKGLKAWGYVPVEGKYVCPEVRTLENCCEDLEWALTDPEIKGIFCVRGGFASCEVMEAIDRDLIKKAKKPIIGFSDISACHSAWTVQGLPSIHASMSGAFTSLPEECVEVEKRMLQGEVPTYRFGRCEYDKPGTAEGILIGGNLTVTKTVLNTGFDCTKIDQPYIILLEDVESNFLNIHLSFTMLKNNGVLDHAAGIILG